MRINFGLPSKLIILRDGGNLAHIEKNVQKVKSKEVNENVEL